MTYPVLGALALITTVLAIYATSAYYQERARSRSTVKEKLRAFETRNKHLHGQIVNLDEELTKLEDREDSLIRQREALRQGVRRMAYREQEALHDAWEWVRMCRDAERRAGDAYLHGYQQCQLMVADDLLALAGRYDEAGRAK